MADGDGLENHCGGNVTVGSNPTPSAHDQALWLAYPGAGAEDLQGVGAGQVERPGSVEVDGPWGVVGLIGAGEYGETAKTTAEMAVPGGVPDA